METVHGTVFAEQTEDLDIPAEQLQPEPVKLWPETIVATGDPNTLYTSWPINNPPISNSPISNSPIYRWEIPLDSMPGYVLPIEIADALNLDHARQTALAVTIPTSTLPPVSDDDGPYDRPLTPMERSYILAYDPMIVRDTTLVTLAHGRALMDNEKLQAENDALTDTKRILAEAGIDPKNPHAWINEQRAAIELRIRRDDEKAKYDRQQIANHIKNAIKALRALELQTGFADPDPLPPPRPDYSPLNIYASEDLAGRYPELADANWLTHLPIDPPDADEAAALDQLFNADNGLIAEWMRGPRASFNDQMKMEKTVRRLKALIGA